MNECCKPNVNKQDASGKVVVTTMSFAMAMDVPNPAKHIEEFINTTIVVAPVELHPYFQAFRTLHHRKYVSFADYFFIFGA